MRNFILALVVLLLHYNEASSSFITRPLKGLSMIRGRATNSQLHWSCSVECNDCDNEGSSFTSNTPSSINTSEKKTFDLTSPREWLEFCEQENGNGAYTVMRCDYEFLKRKFRTWGTVFHLKRLESSFASIAPTNIDLASHNMRQKSEETINFLLKQAEQKCQDFQPTNDKSHCTFMVTILWQPDNDDVKVQGHIFSTLTPTDMKSSLSSNPLTAAIVLDPDLALPNRFQNAPEAKLVAWCRTRRPLEEKFKINGVNEVLLTRKRELQVEILEGLTSNVFVLYPGGRLRTCETDDSVLGGYARHLVIQAAKACDLTIEIGPIHIEEAGLWHEVFLTSSIRVLGPVGEIILPDSDGSSKSLWRLGDVSRKDAASSLVWKQLLSEIYRTVRSKD